MKTHESRKMPTRLVVLLISLVSLVTLFILVLSNDRNQAPGAADLASESGAPEDADFSVRAPIQKAPPTPVIGADTRLPELTEPALEDPSLQHDVKQNEEIPAASLQEPTEQQLEYQTLLEQKVDGDIQVQGPLLPGILNSQEFAALTKRQRDAIAQRIVDRLNSGELRPEDVYPR